MWVVSIFHYKAWPSGATAESFGAGLVREHGNCAERPHPSRVGARRPLPLGETVRVRNSAWAKMAEMSNFYHMLWFWDGDHLPTASFRQKLFLLEAGDAPFCARIASAERADG